LIRSSSGVILASSDQEATGMTMQTFFVVQPYQETARGALVALPAISAKDIGHALRLVSHQQRVAVGVIAFSRRGDPETGDYEEAVVLSRWGRVPDEDDMAEAAA
jgi:hypothetical protein